MKIRKILAAILTAALILTLMPATAFAAGEMPDRPTDAYFSGAPSGIPGGTTLNGLYTYGAMIEAFYNGDMEYPGRIFHYGNYSYKDRNGVTQKVSGFLEEGADPSKFENYATVNIDYDRFTRLKEGENNVPILIVVPTVGKDGKVYYDEFYKTLSIWVSIDRPIKVKFIPAKGFKLKGNVGYNYLDEEDFYGAGNQFIVTVETKDDPRYVTPAVGAYEIQYKYYRSKDGSVEGFYDHGNPNYERFDMWEGKECYLKKGLNKNIAFTYYAYAEGLSTPIKLKFYADITANKYNLYAARGKVYGYTGKVIKPKFKLYNTDDVLISADEYTYKAPKNKKMGWYTVKLYIKDKYKSKYAVSTVTTTYGIGPKAPKITNLTPGKKKITVKWKKLKKSQLKKVDGMYIEISTDRHFLNNYKKIKLTKKQIKAGKKTIKGLKKGKRYYIRATFYKYIKQNGTTIKMPSPNSNLCNRKTL